MHAARLSLVGTMSLVLLGAGAVTTAAQSDDTDRASQGSAVVSGEVHRHLRTTAEPTMSYEPDRVTYREQAYAIDLDVGDPRLTGELWATLNYDTFHDSQGSVITGVAGLELEDGSWQGTVEGYGSLVGGNRVYFQFDLTGQGGYDGLSAVLFLMHNGYQFEAEGMIFDGPPPPAPAMPAE
jgi:hypothetical protein